MTEPKTSRHFSRKWLLSLAALLALSVLTWNNMLDSAGFVAGLLGTVGAYIAGNVYQKQQEPKP